ncbi:MAG: CoA pyrophosphatase, partial [Candidatus Margulisbacteria bacterium]|nr:CoA pyrophosphatase [Candidatus Margulisiibacteriota bacterium]
MDIKSRILKILEERKRIVLSNNDTVPASVLIPIFLKDGKEYILYTKRSEAVNTHKGQISFPGGVRD